MKRTINYLKYLLKHKYYVYKFGRFLGVGRLQLLIHDWHKFLPSEWFPYIRTFYAANGSAQYEEDLNFNYAWLNHIHRAKHHWQHWVLHPDSGGTYFVNIPKKYIKEMVADWASAGFVIHGKIEVGSWYDEQIKLRNILVSKRTAFLIEEEIKELYNTLTKL